MIFFSLLSWCNILLSFNLRIFRPTRLCCCWKSEQCSSCPLFPSSSWSRAHLLVLWSVSFVSREHPRTPHGREVGIPAGEILDQPNTLVFSTSYGFDPETLVLPCRTPHFIRQNESSFLSVSLHSVTSVKALFLRLSFVFRVSRPSDQGFFTSMR